MKHLCTIILLLISTSLIGQKTISVVATGKYEARDLTLEEVKTKAIDEARKEAMRKAGITENVSFTDFLYTFEDNDKFQDIFQSFVATETGAEIIVNEVKEINKDINEFGNILIEVEIEATVYKHKKEKDPSFFFKVEGLREFYYEKDPLSFTFTPAREGFLKIFNVTDQTAFMLYPFESEEYPSLNDVKGKKFDKELEYTFPINENMEGYYFEIDNPTKSKEYNLLIFVYTKKDIAFLEEPSVESIMKWIYTLPPDQRSVQQFGIIVNK